MKVHKQFKNCQYKLNYCFHNIAYHSGRDERLDSATTARCNGFDRGRRGTCGILNMVRFLVDVIVAYFYGQFTTFVLDTIL